MYRGRLRNGSGANQDHNRWLRPIMQPYISSTPKDHDGNMVSVGEIVNDASDLNTPSTIHNSGVNSFAINKKYAYAYDSGYEAVYAEKLVVHTVENIIGKPPALTNFAFPSRHGKWRWLWLFALPLLLLAPLFFPGSAELRRSLCAFGVPFLSSPLVISGPNLTSTLSDDDIKKLEAVLFTVDSRLGIVEDAVKRLNLTAADKSAGANISEEINRLRLLFSNLNQKLADLESTFLGSRSNSHAPKEEISAIKDQLLSLKSNMDLLETERKLWRNQVDDFLLKNQKQQLDLADISSRLDSTSKSDCNCPPALLPAGEFDREAVNKLILEAINRYDADKTGLPDYALEPAGGTILSTRCTETYPSNTREFSIWGFRVPFWPRDYSPRTVIQPGLAPGECWAFKGATGYLVIRLSTLIQVTAVSYEHIPKEISPDGHIFSAPKKLEVMALTHEMDQNGTLLGVFEYNADGPPLQYFPMQAVNASPTEIVELRVQSNHGHPIYTCLYRFRVHGKRINPGWPTFDEA